MKSDDFILSGLSSCFVLHNYCFCTSAFSTCPARFIHIWTLRNAKKYPHYTLEVLSKEYTCMSLDLRSNLPISYIFLTFWVNWLVNNIHQTRVIKQLLEGIIRHSYAEKRLHKHPVMSMEAHGTYVHSVPNRTLAHCFLLTVDRIKLLSNPRKNEPIFRLCCLACCFGRDLDVDMIKIPPLHIQCLRSFPLCFFWVNTLDDWLM